MEFNRIQTNTIRCCSFCRRPGHTVNNCNSVRLVNFEQCCLIEIHLSIRYNERPKERYLNWLFEYSLHNNDLIKAYGSSKLGVNIRNRRIGDIVYDIYNYHCRIYSIPESCIPNNNYINLNINENISYINNINENIDINENMDNIIQSLILLNSIGSLTRNQSRRIDIDIKLEETQVVIEENKECCICYEEHMCYNFVTLDCKHEFCKNCIKTQLKNITTSNTLRCGLCRHNVKCLEVKTNEILEELTNL